MTGDPARDETQKIGFGGGCHWCTEAVFQSLRGVTRVEQGFIRSDPPADSWSEAVIVHFDPAVIDLPTLIEVHLRTHSATREHALRSKYRSALYAFDDAQRFTAEKTLAALQGEFEERLVTQVLAFQAFQASDARFQNYYATDPERPFCKRHIDPKLDLIRARFAEHAGEGERAPSHAFHQAASRQNGVAGDGDPEGVSADDRNRHIQAHNRQKHHNQGNQKHNLPRGA